MHCLLLLLVAAFVAVVAGSEPPAAYKVEEYKQTEYKQEEQYDGYSRQLYRGMFLEKCEKDGFYYKSEYSFVMCSNGNSYEQRCAPGSRNSGYRNYQDGTQYYLHDFCDENMQDYAHGPGYGVKPQPKGYNEVPKPDGYEVKHETVDNYKKPDTTYQPKKPAPTYEKPNYGKPEVVNYGNAAFRGLYHGKCSADGFYFNNDASFVMCSNGIGYVQKCAPGSQNSAYGRYNKGYDYQQRDFCDVNLVDYGYAAHFGNHGYYPNPRFANRAYGYY